MHARNRKSLIPALAIALAIAAGCQPSPEQPVRPDDTSTASPSPTFPATALPSSVTSDTLVSSPDTPDTPLPSPSADSNLDAADQGDVEGLLDGSDVSQYLPDDLIHDGGVILFRTLSLGTATSSGATANGSTNSGPTTTTTADPAATDAPTATGAAAPPQKWVRENVQHGGRQDRLRISDDPSTHDKLVDATLRTVMRGTFAYENARGKIVRNRFTEVFSRELRLRHKKNDKWRLDAVAPIVISSQPAPARLTIDAARFYQGTSSAPFYTVNGTTDWQTPGKEPALSPGELVRLEVEAQNSQGDVFAFADLVGPNDRTRQQLYDDGTHGDRSANDGVFTGTFTVPATTGLRHFAIDVLDPADFTPTGPYRALAWGLSFQVQSP
ncbi:MAG TPA: choice-of-anchor X domain-containing protein [Oscillatoriaceae cyanobacterium]